MIVVLCVCYVFWCVVLISPLFLLSRFGLGKGTGGQGFAQFTVLNEQMAGSADGFARSDSDVETIPDFDFMDNVHVPVPSLSQSDGENMRNWCNGWIQDPKGTALTFEPAEKKRRVMDQEVLVSKVFNSKKELVDVSPLYGPRPAPCAALGPVESVTPSVPEAKCQGLSAGMGFGHTTWQGSPPDPPFDMVYSSFFGIWRSQSATGCSATCGTMQRRSSEYVSVIKHDYCGQ